MAARDVKLKTYSQPSKLGIYAGPQHGNRFFLKNKHTIIFKKFLLYSKPITFIEIPTTLQL